MDSEQMPPSEENPIPPETHLEISNLSFWRRYRWYVLGIVATIIIIIGLGIWLTGGRSQPPKAAVSVNASSTHVTSSSNQPLTSSNQWKSTVNPTAIPLGDGKVSTVPQAGYVDSCTTTFKGGGARHAGSWINATSNTWDSQTKIAVEGSVSWPAADYSEATSGANRVFTTNDLPENYPTGIFPISSTDPAYQYDTNPNHITTQSLNYSLPLNPTASTSPGCLPLGPIGILNDGVVLFDALDDAGRDAVAHETQDSCNGHPNGQEMYHYHNVPSCLRDKATGSSTLVGYAFDGYGIYVERDSKGNLPTDADLDACHGRVSQVMWNGKLTNMYHYDATLEYPYTLGCFHASDAVSQRHG